MVCYLILGKRFLFISETQISFLKSYFSMKKVLFPLKNVNAEVKSCYFGVTGKVPAGDPAEKFPGPYKISCADQAKMNLSWPLESGPYLCAVSYTHT